VDAGVVAVGELSRVLVAVTTAPGVGRLRWSTVSFDVVGDCLDVYLEETPPLGTELAARHVVVRPSAVGACDAMLRIGADGAPNLTELGGFFDIPIRAERVEGAVPKLIQVTGHTDDSPPTAKIRERFPTNWELSVARASNVVRFLQESAGIPGKRLIAAGFGQYRPVATNANHAGRARNRRIEIVLMPQIEPVAGTTARR
jgi:hypothetical protein